jgi:GxxExxY protein
MDRGGPRERRGIPLSDLDPNLTQISHKVIGCARDVHISIGPGYDRAVYLEALKQEMQAQAINFKVNHPFEVKYKDRVVGHAPATLFIEDKFLVEVLATPGEVGGTERTALRARLRAADLTLGLIINFAGRLLKDGLVRVLNVDKINREKGITDEHGVHDDYDDQHDHPDAPVSGGGGGGSSGTFDPDR